MPSSPWSRQWSTQSMYASVANSTSSTPCQGPSWWMSSALYRPWKLSASAFRSHLLRVQRQVGPQRAGRLPAHHEAAEHVHDERLVHPAAGGLHVREVRHPQVVRRSRLKLPRHQGGRAVSRLVAACGTDGSLSPHDAAQPQLPHQTLGRAAGHTGALTVELCPEFVGPVHCRCASHAWRMTSFSSSSRHWRTDAGQRTAA
jgi:hypothetical protein